MKLPEFVVGPFLSLSESAYLDFIEWGKAQRTSTLFSGSISHLTALAERIDDFVENRDFETRETDRELFVVETLRKAVYELKTVVPNGPAAFLREIEEPINELETSLAVFCEWQKFLSGGPFQIEVGPYSFDRQGIPACGFCGKSQSQVKMLIAGPSFYICSECVGLCQEILIEQGKDTIIT